MGRARTAGFTLLEVVISAALLGLLMLAATVAVRTAVRSTDQSMRLTATHGADDRMWESILGDLRSAARVTLHAVPPGGSVAEPMVNGEVYDNVTYRIRAEASNLDTALQPGLESSPFHLKFDPAEGHLEIRDRRGTRRVSDDVLAFRLTRKGRYLSVSLGRRVDGEELVEQHTLFLRNP